MADTTSFAWEGGTLSAVRHGPPRAPAALVLTHGAGNDMHTPLLVSVADAAAAGGFAAVRFNMPYRERGRRAPGSQSEAEAGYRAVAEQVATEQERVFLGGKSYGGRIASHIVADGFGAAGLVFLGYPLHPPGKPERLRDEHLARIRAPMLFLQGTRDPFAQTPLIRRTVEALPTATLVEIEGGDHSFKVKGRALEEVVAEIAGAVLAFLRAHT